MEGSWADGRPLKGYQGPSPSSSSLLPGRGDMSSLHHLLPSNELPLHSCKAIWPSHHGLKPLKLGQSKPSLHEQFALGISHSH